MIPIDSATLQLGVITQCNYFSANGELRIAAGTRLTIALLTELEQGSQVTLYIKNELPEKTKEDTNPPACPATAHAAIMLRLTADSYFTQTSFGELGFNHLISHTVLPQPWPPKNDTVSDQPSGLPLFESMRSVTIAQRSRASYNKVRGVYTSSCNQIDALLTTVASGQAWAPEWLMEIVSALLNNFIADPTLLFNLLHNKSSDAEYLYYHSVNVALLSMTIATELNYSEPQIRDLCAGALLHDLGMLLVAPEIRFKTDPLSSDEHFEIKKHPAVGLHCVKSAQTLPTTVRYSIIQSHEREDGSGYPYRLRGNKIHAFAKIVALADMYDALTSPRCYRNAVIPYRAIELIIGMARQGQVDGKYVKALLAWISLFPVGSSVELNDGSFAKVICANRNSFGKPIICVLTEADGSPLCANHRFEIDLARSTSLYVKRAHPAGTILEEVDSGFL